MKSGFAVINKPPVMTSSDVVVRVRRCFPKGTRVGHMGTLDPGAGGVLPVGVGRAARLFDYVIDKDKEYIAEMQLGNVTDTQDRFGTILSRAEVHVDRAALTDALSRFCGDILQIPPAYSAVKKDGKRLYQLAREGADARVPARAAHIAEIELLSYESPSALLRVVCGKGTYIRTLLHDIGAMLGCGAHMTFLVRTRSGAFRIEDAVSVDTFAKAGSDMSLLPMDLPLSHLPALDFDASDTMRVRSGGAFPVSLMSGLQEDDVCRAYLCGAFAGILHRKGDALRWKAMLLEDTP